MNIASQINAQIRERRRQLNKNVVVDERESPPWDSLDEEDDD